MWAQWAGSLVKMLPVKPEDLRSISTQWKERPAAVSCHLPSMSNHGMPTAPSQTNAVEEHGHYLSPGNETTIPLLGNWDLDSLAYGTKCHLVRKQSSLIQQIPVVTQESFSAPEAVTHVPKCHCLSGRPGTMAFLVSKSLPCHLQGEPQD